MLNTQDTPPETAIARAMLQQLSQADLKAIVRSRGFQPESVHNPGLMQHLLLSGQGMAEALAPLSEPEIAGLHLLHLADREVDVEFFTRIYPELGSVDRYASYHRRFKALFQQVKRQFVLRGLLLFWVLPEGFGDHSTTLERTRFRFPTACGALLPEPFQARQLAPGTVGQHRGEVLRNKLLAAARLEPGSWRLEKGELFLEAETTPFRFEHLVKWQRAQVTAATGGSVKHHAEVLPEVALLFYALGRLRSDEWLVPESLAGLWRVGRPGKKEPEPQAVCAAAYEWGCAEKQESSGTVLYRLPRREDTQADNPPEHFLEVSDPQDVGVRLERTPLAVFERLCQISRLRLIDGAFRAEPDFLKISRASPETVSDPVVGWLRECHPAFGNTLRKVEERRGRCIIHENLLVARIRDLSLKVMLEKQFGGAGRFKALSSEHVAFPVGLLPAVRAWLRKSGHVVKTIEAAGEAEAAKTGGNHG